MKKFILFLFVITVLFLSACAPPADGYTTLESDSGIRFNQTYDAAPVDPNVYDIRGEVVLEAEGFTRQVSPAYAYGTSYYGGYGSVQYVGQVIDGKTFVRVKVVKFSPEVDNIVEGETVLILKMTDTKAQTLMVGDTVNIKCRRQYEGVAALEVNEVFDVDKYGTWEFDFCRITDAKVK